MIINFNITRENNNGQVEYFNSRGQAVKTYELHELNEWTQNETFVSDVFLTEYLDENWVDLTTRFYNAMNPTEFKSQNTPNQIVR